ncbi:MAG: FHA domain-containing protein [Oligoflexales bacterium]
MTKPDEKQGVIHFFKDEQSIDAVRLRQDNTILGREKADIIIDDDQVSATHCQIHKISGTYHLFDMNSTNGTWLNSERVVRAKLRSGDKIRVGNTHLEFHLEEQQKAKLIGNVFSKKMEESEKTSVVNSLIEQELASAAAWQLELAIQYPDASTEHLVFHQNILLIGRASSFGKFDEDTEISRNHLAIKVNDSGDVFIEDQGSTNGSYLNGERISGIHLITPEDNIRVGGCEIKAYIRKKQKSSKKN